MLTRRRFLGNFVAIVAAGAVPTGLVTYWQRTIAQKKGELKAVIFDIAKKYQRFVTNGDRSVLLNPNTVAESLLVQFKDEAIDDAAKFQEALNEKIQKEFNDGFLTYRDGWPLARTEIKLLQIAATLPAAS